MRTTSRVTAVDYLGLTPALALTKSNVGKAPARWASSPIFLNKEGFLNGLHLTLHWILQVFQAKESRYVQAERAAVSRAGLIKINGRSIFTLRSSPADKIAKGKSLSSSDEALGSIW